jgi:hypothetical protein
MSRVLEVRNRFLGKLAGDGEDGELLFRAAMRQVLGRMTKEELVEFAREWAEAVYAERVAPHYPGDRVGSKVTVFFVGEGLDATLQDL